MSRNVRRALLTLTLLLSSFATSSVLPARSAPSADRKPETHELFGFWTTDNGMTTTLIINNPTNQAHDLALELYDDQGKLLAQRPFSIQPAASIDLPLMKLVERNELGYLRLSFPQGICMLPAQAVVSTRYSAWPIWPPAPSRSHNSQL